MSFQETSDAIWNGMNGNSPFDEGKKDTGPYTADFYGLEAGADVDFRALESFLKVLLDTAEDQYFDFRKYATNKKYWGKNPNQMRNGMLLARGNSSFFYRDNKGKQHQARMLVLLNRRKDLVYDVYGTYKLFKPAFNKLSGIYKLEFYYTGGEDKMQYVEDNDSDTDYFTINDKYIAIQFEVKSFDDFYQLCKRLLPKDEVESILDSSAEEYTELLNNTNDLTLQAKFYALIPEILKQRISDRVNIKTLLQHLNDFRIHDEKNPLYDTTSKGIVSLLQLAIVKDSKKLFTFFREDPAFTKFLYFNMHGNTILGNQEVECRFAYVSILMGLCFLNGFEGLKITGHKYQVGKMYEPDSNIQIQNDKTTDVIYLRPYKSYVRQPEWYEEIYNPWGFVVDETSTGKGHWYHPLDMIVMIDEDSPDKTAMLVPAIFVKYFADAKEWEDVLRVVKLLVDVLIIILSVVTLGSSSMLLFIFSVADLALATADFLINLNSDVLMMTKEGQDFLKYWEKISLIGGLALAAPFLIVGAFRSGLKLLMKAGNAETKNLIRSSLVAIIMHQNIYLKLESSSLRLLLTEQEVMKAFNYSIKSSQLKLMQENNVLLLKGNVFVDDVMVPDQYFIIYDGKIIAAGESRAVEEVVTDLCKLKKGKLAEELSERSKKQIQKLAKKRVKKSYRTTPEINPNFKNHLDFHKSLRVTFHDKSFVKKNFTKVTTKIDTTTDEILTQFKSFLETNPNLIEEFNIASVKIKIWRNKKFIDEIDECYISGSKNKIETRLGKNPKLPENYVAISEDDELNELFKEFGEKAKDFKDRSRIDDTELKAIFNFYRKHLHRGNRFIFEVFTILTPCDSCRREFLMLAEKLNRMGIKATIKIRYTNKLRNMDDVYKLM